MLQTSHHVYFAELPPLPMLRVYALERLIDEEFGCDATMPRLDDDAVFHVIETAHELLEHCVEHTIGVRALDTMDLDLQRNIRHSLRADYPVGRKAIAELVKIAHARRAPRDRIRKACRLPGWLEAIQYHGFPFLRNVAALGDRATWNQADWNHYFHLLPQDEYRLVICSAARDVLVHTPKWYTETRRALFAPCFAQS